MLGSLVVGFGRSGAGLHVGALATAARSVDGLFSDAPVVACDPAARDPRWEPARTPGTERRGVLTVPSLDRVTDVVPVDSTVVHVCTPPTVRFDVLAELAALGFRRVIVEKPLATGVDELERIDALRARHGMEIAVVAHWLSAELTRRLHDLVQGGRLGRLRRVRFRQHKPRFRRSAVDTGHSSAFDVEVPHSVGVALRLAGPAELRGAECTPMRLPGRTLPWMGGARLTLAHRGGTRTEIMSDLTSPVRKRCVTLEFESGRAVGHYPLSEGDEHAQLTVTGGAPAHEVFPDDALSAFLRDTYRQLRDHDPALGATFELHREVVRLCGAARERCGVTERTDGASRAG